MARTDPGIHASVIRFHERAKGALFSLFVRTATIAEFARSPIGRYVSGPNWFYFCAHAELAGFVAWERVEVQDLAPLGPIVKTMHTRSRERYAALIDLRRVSTVDAAVFEVTAGYAKTYHARIHAAVRRVGVLRGEGFLGAIARGYFEVVPRPYPEVRVFSDAREALTWLGSAADLPVLEEIDEIVAIEHAGGFLRDLRTFLDAQDERVTLETAARHLRLAPRTLQRRLREEGSSLQTELMAARLRAAQRLMLATDAPLTEIAFDAGFASPAHLSTQFRKALGEAPSTWRARHRPSARG